MRQQDALHNRLESSTSLYSDLLRDPIFTPLFTAVGLGGTLVEFTTGVITYAQVASTIVTTAAIGSLYIGGRPK